MDGYAILWKQDGRTAVSRSSATIKLLDPAGTIIELCAGWGFGEKEPGGNEKLEETKSEYRSLAALHSRGEFPYDQHPGAVGSYEGERDRRDTQDFAEIINAADGWE